MLPIKHTYGRKSFAHLVKGKELIEKYLYQTYKDSDNLHVIDGYPGPGIFAQGLHEILKPKKTFLLEPHVAYHDYLQDQKWVNSSGVVLSKADPFRWATFTELQAEHELPQHDRSDIHRDLIYMANLTNVQGEQLCTQYLNCITNQSWLESLGRVKLLLWVRESTALKVIAKQGTRHRSRVSVQCESAAESRLLLEKTDSTRQEQLYFPNRKPFPVLLELDPLPAQVANVDSFEYVIKMIFVLKSKPLFEGLAVLGPGAQEYMAPRLPAEYLKKTPTSMTIEEIQKVTEVFHSWPFKPDFLHDFYEENLTM